MSVAQMLVEWLDKKSEEWIDSQEGLGEIYAEAQVEAAQHCSQSTLLEDQQNYNLQGKKVASGKFVFDESQSG